MGSVFVYPYISNLKNQIYICKDCEDWLKKDGVWTKTPA